MNYKVFNHPIRPPLFERFINTNPFVIEESLDHNILTNKLLKKSIYDWLYIVFNTRPTAKNYLSNYDNQDKMTESLPIYFGLSDFSWFDTAEHLNLGSITRVIEDVIARYEPRLTQVSVIILNKDTLHMGLSIKINAMIKMIDYQERVNFPFLIENIFQRS